MIDIDGSESCDMCVKRGGDNVTGSQFRAPCMDVRLKSGQRRFINCDLSTLVTVSSLHWNELVGIRTKMSNQDMAKPLIEIGGLMMFLMITNGDGSKLLLKSPIAAGVKTYIPRAYMFWCYAAKTTKGVSDLSTGHGRGPQLLPLVLSQLSLVWSFYFSINRAAIELQHVSHWFCWHWIFASILTLVSWLLEIVALIPVTACLQDGTLCTDREEENTKADLALVTRSSIAAPSVASETYLPVKSGSRVPNMAITSMTT